jgi:hypothetical protein
VPQVVLDPAEPVAGPPIRPGRPLPMAARLFGRLPDTSVLLPGDIVLFNRIDRRFSHRAIERVQGRYGFAADDARWHHAAIYVGQDAVCEAGLGGVRFHTMLDRLTTYRLRVRRLPDLDERTRFDIAVQAMSNLRRRYGCREIMALLVGQTDLGARYLVNRRFQPICSVICADAYGVVGVALHTDVHRRPTLPADLSLSPILADVPLRWRPLAD